MLGTLLKTKEAGSSGASFGVTDSGITTDTSLVFRGTVGDVPEAFLEVAFTSGSTDPSPSWTLVSSDADGRQMELVTKRGRQDELKEPETGSATTILFNQDRYFDPAYSLSPYSPYLLPVRPVRFSVTWGTTVYRLFRGDVEEWPPSWQNRLNTVPLSANDGFDALSQVSITITRPEETTGQRISAILDAAMWPVTQRNLDTGQTVLHPNTYEGTALELIRNAVKDEDGYFFMDGNGNATFIERHARFKPPYLTPYLTLSNRPTGGQFPLADADVRVDHHLIKNQVKLTIGDVVETQLDGEGQEVSVVVEPGQEVYEEDADSMSAFRPRTLTFPSSSIADVNEAVVKAQYHLERLKDPVVRVRRVIIEPQMDSGLWDHVFAREIGDRIRVEIYPPQTGTEEIITFEGIIEYVEHRQRVGHWQTVWNLSPADLNTYWILDHTDLSELGVTTKVGY